MRTNIFQNHFSFLTNILQCTYGAFLNGINVPVYQRPYTWGDEMVKQMFYDFSGHIQDGTDYSYYLGNLVFVITHTNTGNKLSILDGQQRLTTLYLYAASLNLWIDEVILAIGASSLSQSEKHSLSYRLDLLKSALKGHMLDSSGSPYLQFHYPDDNAAFRYCLSSSFSMSTAPTGLSRKHKMIVAIKNISNCIEEYLSNCISPSRVLSELDLLECKVISLNELASFIIGNSAEVTYTVVNEGMEFSIFETLNNRGEQLNIYDLTRNIMINVSGKDHLNIAQETIRKFDDEVRKNCIDPKTNRFKRQNAEKLILDVWNMRFKGKISSGKYMKAFTSYVKESDSETLTNGGGFIHANESSLNNFNTTMNYILNSSYALSELLSPEKNHGIFCKY